MDDYKTFQDPVHGYIKISKDLCNCFIDTDIFQRLRRIEQTSARVLYPSAHHDRFAHSLGVYHIGSLCLQYIIQNSGKDLLTSEVKISFQIACLLHDCAHSPFSHTFEKYYTQWGNEKLILEKIISLANNDKNLGYDYNNRRKPPSPHELVSSFIAIEKYQKEIVKLGGDPALIVRMIIGLPYDSPEKDIENCMISLLNGPAIDVDKLDYIMRDSWASGTNNVKIDLSRLLSAILIRKDENQIYKVFFTKRALNVIKNVIDGRNFLYQWIYTHHKVLYEQYLIKESLKKISEKISLTEEAFLKNLFSADTFSNPIRYNNFVFYLPCDGDLFYIIKQFRTDFEEIEELLTRKYLRKALWKTIAEYVHYFDAIDDLILLPLKKEAEQKLNSFLISKNIQTPSKVLDPSPKTIFIQNDEVMIDFDGRDAKYTSIFKNSEIHFGSNCFIPYVPAEAIIHKNEIISMFQSS